MWSNYLITYLHYISIIFVFIGVFMEFILVRKTVTAENFKRILLADTLYGVFSIFVVGSGLMRVFMYGKGSEYYFSNWIFNTKFSLFVVAGLLSILPTVLFARLKKQQKNNPTELIELPKFKTIKTLIRLELFILLLMPLLAVLMANGVGI